MDIFKRLLNPMKLMRSIVRLIVRTILTLIIYPSLRILLFKWRYSHTELEFTRPNHSVFFGYYDISPFSHNDKILLACSSSKLKGTIKAEDYLDVGYFNLDDPKTFISIGSTSTWCWQQGARLRWLPGSNNNIVYNKVIDDGYGCVVQNLATREIVKEIPYPVYDITCDAKYGLGLNFSRLQRLRPGYGYNTFKDSTISQNHPIDDGIFHINLDNNTSELIVSLDDLSRFEIPDVHLWTGEHYINHISINPSGNRFMFFHLVANMGKRRSRLITCDLDGKNMFALENDLIVSHYTWKDDHVLLVTVVTSSGLRYIEYTDQTLKKEIIGDGRLSVDGHPTYLNKDEGVIVTDTYPDPYNDQKLLRYDTSSDKLEVLGRYNNSKGYSGEFRCDLHPRISKTKSLICFDSLHGRYKRSMYVKKLVS